MAREYWAVYSVKDHLADRAFVSDLMLYDRVVVPRPADDRERHRWLQNGWDPDRLDKLIEIIGPERSKVIEWDEYQREQWKNRWSAADRINKDPFQVTRDQLLMGLPPFVTGVQSYLAYPSVAELEQETGLLKAEDQQKRNGERQLSSLIAAVIGKNFLVPAVEAYPNEEGALRRAVVVSSDPEYRRKRAAYWRWQKEFIEDCPRLQFVANEQDIQLTLKQAIEEMNDLIADEQRVLRARRRKFGILFCFTVASSGLTLAGAGPLTPIGLAGAFLSVGTYVVSNMLAGNEGKPGPSAFVTTSRREFGWGDAMPR